MEYLLRVDILPCTAPGRWRCSFQRSFPVELRECWRAFSTMTKYVQLLGLIALFNTKSRTTFCTSQHFFERLFVFRYIFSKDFLFSKPIFHLALHPVVGRVASKKAFLRAFENVGSGHELQRTEVLRQIVCLQRKRRRSQGRRKAHRRRSLKREGDYHRFNFLLSR